MEVDRALQGGCGNGYLDISGAVPFALKFFPI
jgi:hypothetical protein